MRHLVSLCLGAGLLAVTGVGCRTLQCTQGVCDCDPPPVESVLNQPCPHYHPIVHPYGSPYTLPAVPPPPPPAAAAAPMPNGYPMPVTPMMPGANNAARGAESLPVMPKTVSPDNK